MPLQKVNTVIVGAGPAGLATTARLKKADVHFRLIEKGPKAGWSWHNHYERLHLHTIKELSHLPFVPFPESYPRYVSRKDFASYMEDYVAQIGLQPRFDEALSRVSKHEEGWLVETEKDRLVAQNVVFATGYNRIPIMPRYEGNASYDGRVIHSQDYKHARDFKGQKVLVVGMGNTGAEIALDLYEQGAKPFISVRSPVNIIPRDFLGRPAQKTTILLNKLPEGMRDAIGNFMQKLTIGDLGPYGLPSPHYSPSYQVRKLGRIPVIDLGTVREVKAGNIKVLPGIQRFGQKEVFFTDGQNMAFDLVIFCTGYKSRLEEFIPEVSPHLNEKGQPEKLWYRELPGVYFIGFAAPSTGILRSIYHNSQLVAEDIVANRN